MEYVKSFKDLEVYKLSRELAKEIFFLTKGFPQEEKYSLTDQIRRSSRSVGLRLLNHGENEDMKIISSQN